MHICENWLRSLCNTVMFPDSARPGEEGYQNKLQPVRVNWIFICFVWLLISRAGDLCDQLEPFPTELWIQELKVLKEDIYWVLQELQGEALAQANKVKGEHRGQGYHSLQAATISVHISTVTAQ